MRYFILLILVFSIETSYCQDVYLMKNEITKDAIQIFCDTIGEKSFKLGYSSDKGFDKNINIGQGEFYFVNSDSCYVYDFPCNYVGKKVAKLKFSDSIYVFKNIIGKPICISVYGDGFGGSIYYLCLTSTRKLALFKDNECVSKNSLTLSPNSEYFQTTNEFSSLLISKNWKKFIKLPTHNLYWFPDYFQFLYNDCNVNCNENSRIFRFDLKTWNRSLVCKGVSPTFYSNYSSIIYFGDSTINGKKKECVFSHNLKSKRTQLFYEIPDSLTYWSDGDDFRTPSKIELGQFKGAFTYEIYLHKRNQEMNCDHCYIISINELKKVLMIKKL